MVEEGRHSVVEGDARCHSVGDRGNEPHLFLIHFLAGWGTTVWRVSAIIQALILLYSVASWQLQVVSSFVI